jgi:hypothetical protein
VDLARDELLPHARLSRDEDGQVRGRDDGNLGEERGDGGTRSEDGSPARLVGAPLQLASDARPALGALLQDLDERRRPEGRPRERTERREEPRVETVEGARIQGVGRERPDDLAVGRERAAEAGVNPLERVRVRGQEAFRIASRRGCWCRG